MKSDVYTQLDCAIDDLHNSTHLLDEIIENFFDSNSVDTPENRAALAYGFDHYAALMRVYSDSIEKVQTKLQSLLAQLKQ